MGCGPSDDVSARNSKLQVYGDYFSSDTRAVLMACKFAEVDFEFQLINTLKKENQTEEYKRLNPTCSVPMLMQGRNSILAPGFTQFEWLLATNENAERTFHHPDQAQAVSAISRYFYREVRGNTSQLIRRLTMRVQKPDAAPKKDDP